MSEVLPQVLLLFKGRRKSVPKKILIVVAVLFGIVLIGGYFLPLDYSISRIAFIHAEADEIHARVSDLKSWTQWTPWNERQDRTLNFEYSDTVGQVGSTSKWTSDRSGSGSIEIISVESGRGIVYELTIDDFPPAEGIIQITPMKGGCEVLWKLRGKLFPPLGGWLRPFIESMVGSEFEDGLKGLKTTCEPK